MRDRMLRSDEEFVKLLRDIKLERMRNGKDKRPLSDKRLTLAISRIPRLREILTQSEIKEMEKILK